MELKGRSVLINRKLRIYPNAELRSHVLNASTKETERVFRLTKEKQSRKIDAAVALSFAVLAAIQAGKPPSLEELNGRVREIKVDMDFDPRRLNGHY